ncbi:hypothetical protein DN752_21880 [Echinicola strongylocentroti]|uniref:O-antigen ligase domain-containing protein n=1 Tax=Echinicola strongylocentroti TaxID=1795355 RepID=A0A2Z4IP70_9BACT|nr:hypothetical protein [Echinicola strongylocentroti]AWW32584.1 hypothetical protein DN752_21880 [Echinicola strongylocentroti]
MKSSFFRYSLYFLFGFICLSTFSTYLSHLLGFPIGVPEVFACLFIPVLYKEFTYLRTSPVTGGFIIAFLGLIILGIMFSGDVYAVVGTSRVYFYIFYFALLFSRIDKIDTTSLFMVSAGAVIGSGFSNYLLVLQLGQEEVRGYSNFIALSVFVIYPLVKKKVILFLICLGIAIVLAFYSGLRRQIVEVVISLVFGLLILMLYRKGKSLSLMFVAVVVGVFAWANISLIEQYLLENHFYLWQRVFYKTQIAMEDGGSEGSRYEHLGLLLDYFAECIFPRGFFPRGSSFSVGDHGGSTLDFPLFELLYTFSAFGMVVFILWMVSSYVKNLMVLLSLPKGGYSEELMIVLSCIPVLLFATFFDGSFIQYSFVAPFSGYLFGRLFRFSFRNVYQNSPRIYQWSAYTSNSKME